jgi:glycosyltransferase involved in cell wall biosynthesis
MSRIVLLSTSAAFHPGPRRRWIPLITHSGVDPRQVHFVGLHPQFTGTTTATHPSGMQLTHVAQMHVHGHGQALHGIRLLRTALIAALRLAQTTLHLRPETVIICKSQPINGLAALLVRRMIPAHIGLDVDDDEVAVHAHAAPWTHALLAWWQNRLPAYCDSITVASTPLQQLIQPQARKPICHVPNGLSDEQFITPSASDIAEIRRQYALPEQFICYCGNIAVGSHASDLLIAAAQHRHGGLPLVIAGDGHDRPQLQALAQPHQLQWLGHIPATHVTALMHIATATIDPVRDTPAMRARCPLKIPESLAQGTPVISADVGDRAHMLGNAGRLIAADSVSALAQALTDAHHLDVAAHDCRSQADAVHWRYLAPDWASHHGFHH